MNKLNTACDDECDRDDIDVNVMVIVMTTCFLLSYLVRIASSITFSYECAFRRSTTDSSEMEIYEYKRPPNGENTCGLQWLHAFICYLLFFICVVALVYIVLCHFYIFKDGGSDVNPKRIAKHRHQEQQSTVAAKRECF